MTRFVAVTAQDMDDFLTKRGFSKLALSGVNESVYGREMGNGYVLAVFTGIEDGVSRKKGADAIRVSLMRGGRVLSSMSHVKRQANWRDHLTDRFRNWKSMAGDKPCPECGGLMLVRHGRHGEFLGCAAFPECRGKLPRQ